VSDTKLGVNLIKLNGTKRKGTQDERSHINWCLLLPFLFNVTILIIICWILLVQNCFFEHGLELKNVKADLVEVIDVGGVLSCI